MADTPEVFALKLGEFIEKAKAAPKQVVRKFGLDLFSQVVDRSPVDTGQFRWNWNVAFDRVDTFTTPGTDKTGAKTKERIRVLLNGWEVGQAIFFTNSLPYAIPLEYGHSKKQAPLGMVRITVAEAQDYIAKAVAEVKQQ